MERIPIRTLNQDTAGVLARVERGETVEITNRGRPIARIVPASGGELDDLVASGRVVPATVAAPFVAPAGPVEPGAEAGRAAVVPQGRRALVIYLDSSAVVKLIRPEAESHVLATCRRLRQRHQAAFSAGTSCASS